MVGEGSGWCRHFGILHLEKEPTAAAPLKRNELSRKLGAKAGTAPIWWAESPKLTQEAQARVGGPLGRHSRGP